MHPHLFSFGPIQVHSYGFFMALAFLAGVVHWYLLGRRAGRTLSWCADLMLWVMVSGVLGARLAYVLEHIQAFLAQPANIFRLDQGGLIFYGGVVAAGIAVVVFARKHGEPLVPLVDFTLTAVPLSHAIGRIGCFLNSCCYGAVCPDSPLCVSFPRHSLPWYAHVRDGYLSQQAEASLPVYPVQLFETGYNLLVYGVLLWLFRKQRPGTVTGAYLVLYAAGRFGLEFFRGDFRDRVVFWSLSAGQWASIPLFLVGIVILVHMHMRAMRG